MQFWYAIGFCVLEFFLNCVFILLQVNSVRLMLIFKYLYYRNVSLKNKHFTNEHKNAHCKYIQNAQDSNCSYECQCSNMCRIIHEICFCHVAIGTSKWSRITIIQRNLSHSVSLKGRVLSMLYRINFTLFMIRTLTYINANMISIVCYNVYFLSFIDMAKLKGTNRRQNPMGVAAKTTMLMAW